MPNKILVTGAGGNVGREVIKELSDRGRPFVAAVRNETDGRREWGRPTATVRFDFADPATYAAAFDGIGQLFLVRPPAISDVQRYLFPVIDFARSAGVEQIVFLSLLGVNRRVPHYQVEKKIEASGIPYTFLRPSYFMQNLNTAYREGIRDQGEIFLPAGRGKMSFIDVRDIGAVAARVLTEPGHLGQRYTLTGSQALDYFQVARILTRVLGREIRYANPTPRQYEARMRQQQMPEALIQVMLGLYFTIRWGFGAKRTRDVQRLLGRPPLTLDQFVEDYSSQWQPAAEPPLPSAGAVLSA